MNKTYTIDGRDPNAKGYVKENRLANQQETDALVKILDGWGIDVKGYSFYLYGRLDDVHGWYLFGMSRVDGGREDFVVLGDCLDAMEAPYDKVLDMNEVLHFARTAGSGENIGTAYDAMQDWGVFNSISAKQESVWVLTIYKNGQFFPEVHRTLDGAVMGAMNDIAEHMDEDEVDDYDNEKIESELEGQQYWRDDIKNVVYDIAECRVFA